MLRTHLPLDVFEVVVDFLPVNDFVSLLLTSSQFHHRFNTLEFWKRLYFRDIYACFWRIRNVPREVISQLSRIASSDISLVIQSYRLNILPILSRSFHELLFSVLTVTEDVPEMSQYPRWDVTVYLFNPRNRTRRVRCGRITPSWQTSAIQFRKCADAWSHPEASEYGGVFCGFAHGQSREIVVDIPPHDYVAFCSRAEVRQKWGWTLWFVPTYGTFPMEGSYYSMGSWGDWERTLRDGAMTVFWKSVKSNLCPLRDCVVRDRISLFDKSAFRTDL